jgi:hypothetical protein
LREDDWINWPNHAFGSNFTFSRAQYAMKQHRLGLGWDSTHTLNFLKPPLDTSLCKCRHIISFEAKVVSDRLFLRIEDRHRLPLRNTDDMSSFTRHILCAHSYQSREQHMPRLVKCRLNHYFNGKEVVTLRYYLRGTSNHNKTPLQQESRRRAYIILNMSGLTFTKTCKSCLGFQTVFGFPCYLSPSQSTSRHSNHKTPENSSIPILPLS